MRTILATLSVLALATVASAQAPAQPAHVTINNATPGINIAIFLDAGKVQTAKVDPKGTTGFDLDFLSLGKPQGQVYIETCKDGQRIRIISQGTTVADEDGCNRKPVGVIFTFTCTKKITINFAAAKASFAGCGSILTNKWTLVAIGGGVTGVALTTGGGGSTPTFVPTSVVSPSLNTSTSVVTVTPPVTIPTPTTPPVTTPPPPVTVTINPTGTWRVSGCSVGSDPRQHELIVQICRIAQFIVDASGTGFDITAPGTAFPRFGGPLNTTTGAWSLTASNTVSTNVPATWTGRGTFAAATADMVVVMTVTVNGVTDSVTYTFTLTK